MCCMEDERERKGTDIFSSCGILEHGRNRAMVSTSAKRNVAGADLLLFLYYLVFYIHSYKDNGYKLKKLVNMIQQLQGVEKTIAL